MNEVIVTSLDRKFKKIENEIRELALKILKTFKKQGIYLEIYLVDPQKMQFLNKKYRKKDKASEILSFKDPKKFIYPKSRNKRIGEIYLNGEKFINYDSAIKVFLLIHGILHLFGYQHNQKSDRIKMERLENKIFSKLI